MAGEARFTLAPLALADADPAGSPAVQLFAVPRVLRDRTSSGRARTPCLCARSAARLDGLPLAIELAATRVHVLGLCEILAAVERRFAVLAAHDLVAPERFWSLELLIAGSCGVAALSAIVAAAARHDLDHATVTHLLSALVDKSVVTASFPGGEPRYDLLETVRGVRTRPAAQGVRLNAAGAPMFVS